MESSRLRDDDSDFFFINNVNNNDRPRISRHNTMSRRFCPSSNFTISSTASSPGYAFKDEIIDPSTYCFSTALKALQARSGYHTWECSSPTSEGLALNSKWDEAEKYICNPLSGKVPLECLSSKSLLTAKSFRYYSSSSSNRITMSAPLVFSSSSNNNKPFSSSSQDLTLQFPIIPPEKKEEGRTRDVGTQSTPPYVSSSSSSPSAASTPSIMERSIKRVGDSSSPVSNSKTKSEDEDDQVEEEKEKEREGTKRVTVTTTKHDTDEEKKEERVWSKRRQQQEQGGRCFPWTCMTSRFLIRNTHKTDKPRKYHNNVFPNHYSSSSF